MFSPYLENGSSRRLSPLYNNKHLIWVLCRRVPLNESHQRILNERMSDTPISTDDRDKDRNIIRNNLMDELCKRQRNFEANGGDQRWSFREVWQSGFSPYTDRDFVNHTSFSFVTISIADFVSLSANAPKYLPHS